MAINIVLSMRKRRYLRLEHNIAKVNILMYLTAASILPYII